MAEGGGTRAGPRIGPDGALFPGAAAESRASGPGKFGDFRAGVEPGGLGPSDPCGRKGRATEPVPGRGGGATGRPSGGNPTLSAPGSSPVDWVQAAHADERGGPRNRFPGAAAERRCARAVGIRPFPRRDQPGGLGPGDPSGRKGKCREGCRRTLPDRDGDPNRIVDDNAGGVHGGQASRPIRLDKVSPSRSSRASISRAMRAARDNPP